MKAVLLRCGVSCAARLRRGGREGRPLGWVDGLLAGWRRATAARGHRAAPPCRAPRGDGNPAPVKLGPRDFGGPEGGGGDPFLAVGTCGVFGEDYPSLGRVLLFQVRSYMHTLCQCFRKM